MQLWKDSSCLQMGRIPKKDLIKRSRFLNFIILIVLERKKLYNLQFCKHWKQSRYIFKLLSYASQAEDAFKYRTEN